MGVTDQGGIRVLFLADTHLGFDFAFRPRTSRRRRGHDFFANYERVIDRAIGGDVDLVVHGGDLLYRSRVPARLVEMALAPLRKVADAGIPVFLVPGNHERSRIPYPILAAHPRLHLFDRPRSFSLGRRGLRLSVAGFPYAREGVRERFARLVAGTGLSSSRADIRLLCVHHCFEGATVGPRDFTFRGAPDVVRAADVPADCAAVLSGHIHRFQVLTAGLEGSPPRAPVFYPGSIERTSFAEMDEPKGYLLLDIAPGQAPGGIVKRWRFCRLPARPMVVREIRTEGVGCEALATRVRRVLETAPADAVVKLRIRGSIAEAARPALRASSLRAIAPEMNVQIACSGARPRARDRTHRPALDS